MIRTLAALLVLVAGVLVARRALAAADDFLLDEPVTVKTEDSNIFQVDWSRVQYFKPGEFRGELDRLDPAVVYAADQLRHRLGSPLIVSPAPGSISRTDGNPNSQHYAVGRRSTAIDLMPTQASLEQVYRAALDVPGIGGIGLYPEAKPYPMIHIDTRPKPSGRPAQWSGWRKADGSPGWQYAGIDARVFA